MRNLLEEQAATYGYSSMKSADLAKLCGYKGTECYTQSDWYQMVVSLVNRHGRGYIQKITNSKDCFLHFAHLSPLPHEEFWMLLLNRQNGVINTIRVSVGGVAGCVVDAKVIFHHALKHHASGIVLCHNHPSGNTNPSKQDIEITRKLREAGKFLDIEVNDHIIIGHDTYFSFADQGILNS